MRRPVMYFAGLLVATGAGIALSAPAQAAPANTGHGTATSDFPFDGDEFNSYDLDYNRTDLNYSNRTDLDYDYDLDQKVNSCNSHNVGLTLISWTC